jgi:hypothetical protein
MRSCWTALVPGRPRHHLGAGLVHACRIAPAIPSAGSAGPPRPRSAVPRTRMAVNSVIYPCTKLIHTMLSYLSCRGACILGPSLFHTHYTTATTLCLSDILHSRRTQIVSHTCIATCMIYHLPFKGVVCK